MAEVQSKTVLSLSVKLLTFSVLGDENLWNFRRSE